MELERFTTTEQRKKGDAATAALSSNELAELSEDWMEVGLHAVFTHPGLRGQLMRAAYFLKGSSSTTITGSGFGVLDMVSNSLGMRDKIREIKAKGGKASAKDKAYLTLNAIQNAQITASTTTTAITLFAPLAVGAGAILTLSSSTVFAAIMWSAAVVSTAELIKTQRKRNKPKLLLDALLNELQDEQLKESLRQQNGEPDTIPDEQNLQNNAHQLESDKIKRQAIAVLRHNKDRFEQDPKLDDYMMVLGIETLETTPENQNEDQIIESILQLQLKDRATEQAFNTAVWAMAAAGMTLTAISPACPYLAIPGMVLLLSASVLKLGQFLTVQIGHTIARRMMEKEFIAEGKMGKDTDEVNEKLAHELNKGKYQDLNSFQWALYERGTPRRNTYLKAARRRTFDNLVLQERFGENFEALVPKQQRAAVVRQLCKDRAWEKTKERLRTKPYTGETYQRV